MNGQCIHLLVLYVSLLALLMAASAEAGSRGPTDWSDWEKHRQTVVHPVAAIKAEDLKRARRNIERYDWARAYAERMRKHGEALARTITTEYLERMVETTTPATTGPCPACRAKGLPWHPNGQWTWTSKRPDQLTCRVCKTVFPNDAFPESIVIASTWDPRQRLTFVGGETFKCFGYHYARPSHTGMIRARKLGYVTGQLHSLATAFALTDDPRFARAAKAILLRFAQVLPKYLVYAGYGYGEYADCDPHVAAERIMDLPCDELVYPPNKPDRKIWTGYWSASRIGSSGMDGGWVARVAEAYDLTCEAMDGGEPVWSDEERVRIERDVLLEGAYLALCDGSINNKSVGNRAGAAMVGLVVGHPGLVRFGIEGFRRTVDDWFLPDGGTSESAAYAMMTMGGVRTFGLALRDYSEPQGYVGPDGKRIERFNACRDTRYGDCWQGLVWTLQGDLRFPPIADSYRTTAINAHYAELLALCYPTDPHVALLKEASGARPRSVPDAILYREPGLETRDVPRLRLPDVVFPYLAQGYVRRGSDGRDGLAVLNASDWGGHHHYDSLDLHYWQDGHELLSDLGYLWDHPDKSMTTRTLAHNLVLIDGQNQRSKGRHGSFHLFALTPHIKVMEASSLAYPKASLYRRTCVQVDHGRAGSYLVDVFRAAGGTTRDYVFHGPGNDYAVNGLDLAPSEPETEGTRFAVSSPLGADGARPWRVTWQVDAEYEFTAWSPGEAGEKVIIGTGWGQRDHRNTDRGATLPYVFRRRSGKGGRDVFVSVFAGTAKGSAPVKGVRLLSLTPDAPAAAVALAVDTARGTDVITSQLSDKTLTAKAPGGRIATDARVAVVTPTHGCFVGGTRLAAPGVEQVARRAAWTGAVLAAESAKGDSWFVVDGPLPDDDALVGSALFVTTDDGVQRAYPIRDVKASDKGNRIFTKVGHVGFETRPAKTWRVVSTVAWGHLPGAGDRGAR